MSTLKRLEVCFELTYYMGNNKNSWVAQYQATTILRSQMTGKFHYIKLTELEWEEIQKAAAQLKPTIGTVMTAKATVLYLVNKELTNGQYTRT
jgi:hypothetical protein